ncbi:hypothetical protein G8S55_06580 [Clostridium botulinum C]|uniref:hypothetical protein n=1 Tax=Clostridium botulinum TaxID=1491 RepID=UPI001E5A894E|nr:hypothetical protein [Clostridium botulinum]MCD3216919.1 hypothetical protein [Clostridium botulinum C]
MKKDWIVLNSLKEELSEIKACIELAKEDNIQLKEYEMRIKELENQIAQMINEIHINKANLTKEDQLRLIDKKLTELHRKHRMSNRQCKINRKKNTSYGVCTRKRKQLFKQISNKQVRLAKGLSKKSKLYKKIFDLGWEIN